MSIAEVLKSIAQSLRTRLDSINISLANKGQAAAETYDDVPAKIDAIYSGGADVSGVTAAAGDVVEGKIFVDSEGVEQIGTIPEKDSEDITVSGRTVNIPGGRYKNSVEKSIAEGTLADPIISVDTSTGEITATSKVSAEGYLSKSDSKSNTKTLSTQPETTITPGTFRKTAVSSGKYTTGAVYVAGDSNLVASNIKSGVSIFGVDGSYSGGGTPVADETCTIVYDNNADIYCAYIDLTEFYNQCPDRGPASVVIFTIDEYMEDSYADGIVSFAGFSLTGADGSYLTQSLGLSEGNVVHASNNHVINIVTYNGAPALKVVATKAQPYLAFHPDVSYLAVLFG